MNTTDDTFDRIIYNIGQERAKKAFALAKEGMVKEEQNGKNKSTKGNYASYVRRFPMLIKVNGLTYALSFAYSKAQSDPDWKNLYLHVGEWLKAEPTGILEEKLKNFTRKHNRKLMEVVVALEYEELMWATAEVIELFDWLKRFAYEDK